MHPESFDFPKVMLLIMNFDRSLSRERLLAVFREFNCHFTKIVVSDDYSKGQHASWLADLRGRFQFQLVVTTTNLALGNNTNTG
ncbi:hypothetical protein [Persicitalea sp.]|uniref:hypothetical protein n=1 Tax=Persicitalea sp. TaxID=3100273 RepID=UPI00359345FB